MCAFCQPDLVTVFILYIENSALRIFPRCDEIKICKVLVYDFITCIHANFVNISVKAFLKFKLAIFLRKQKNLSRLLEYFGHNQM